MWKVRVFGGFCSKKVWEVGCRFLVLFFWFEDVLISVLKIPKTRFFFGLRVAFLRGVSGLT